MTGIVTQCDRDCYISVCVQCTVCSRVYIAIIRSLITPHALQYLVIQKSRDVKILTGNLVTEDNSF